ncbi:hypothetical protein AVEN_217783-1 [Araneus ventricosus]|uniref:Uncharacterized protein n=1 Tax=Araneus ventricosus TaxID=182803 RepID=A0A4Y2EDM3_ARAVE|nr:hypothetical protein AVEN_217783-1 [Araneus ventricosus]
MLGITRRPRETPVAPQTSLKHLRCAQQTTCLTGFPARWTSGRACEHQRCPRNSPLGTPSMPTQVQWWGQALVSVWWRSL